MLVIFDLDGTLSDNSHRLGLITGRGPKDWDKFHLESLHDSPIIPNVMVSLMIAAFHPIEIWTGRSEIARSITETWLERNFIKPRRLLMRPEGDHRPDDVLKESWLHANEEKPRLVFEDRTRVVQMWRRNGIICHQVAHGDF